MTKLRTIKPTTITILTTYHCTAACAQCCFECSPKLRARFTEKQMHDFIKQSVKEFSPELQVCVFTGGECFSIGKDLVSSVKLAHSLGLRTRCVSNGYWARTKESAKKKLTEMKEAGLDEINISTGDDHQKWVPFQSVVNATVTAATLGIHALISVEGHEESHFKYADAISNSEINEYWKNHKLNNILSVINSVWIPIHKNAAVTQNEKVTMQMKNMNQTNGCDTILNFIGLNPYNKLVACCGLTMEYIDEMKIGSFSCETLAKDFYNQFNDFMKIWLWVDGPEHILYFAYLHNRSLRPLLSNITHPCQACAKIFGSKEIQETLQKHYGEVVESVLLKYELKRSEYEDSAQAVIRSRN